MMQFCDMWFVYVHSNTNSGKSCVTKLYGRYSLSLKHCIVEKKKLASTTIDVVKVEICNSYSIWFAALWLFEKQANEGNNLNSRGFILSRISQVGNRKRQNYWLVVILSSFGESGEWRRRTGSDQFLGDDLYTVLMALAHVYIGSFVYGQNSTFPDICAPNTLLENRVKPNSSPNSEIEFHHF